MKDRSKAGAAWIAIAVLALMVPSAAEANVKQIKAYKEAFAGTKPKCIECHTVEKPKKEGPHDLNDYGKKAKASADAAKKEAPDADTYKQLGPTQ